MTAPREKPSIPEVLPIVRELYSERPTGCCLHIVLDDCNVDDHAIQFCWEYAHKRGHVRCLRLAELLGKMSKRQRLFLARASK